MGEIRILPPEVRKLIAAGEVVERPANVVKELIENSLDAEANKIEVEIVGAGKKLIKVRDNGRGILREDLPKVVEEGATSKIGSLEDIYSLKSFGFRGEALHTISKVAELFIRSRHFSETKGGEIYATNGEVKYFKELSLPVGTTVEVRNLFYTVPVRLKFLKSPQTERKKIVETVTYYALAYPEKEFFLEIEGKEVFNLKKKSVEERLIELFDLEVAPEHITTESELGKAELFYYPNYKTNRFFIFINRRPVFNRELQTYLKNKVGYRTLAVLFLELPPYLMDVNVHPRKEEVKFLQPKKVLELIGNLFRKKIVKPEPISVFSTLRQNISPQYGTNIQAKFEILGQVEEALIVAYKDGFIYFFDQHLLDETVNFHLLGDETRACKSSLKAGTLLDKAQMEELIERWQQIGEPRTCPHGRPIFFKIPTKEIYKKLDRKWKV